VLVGDKNHPEIIGLCGYAAHEKFTVLSSREEAANLKISETKVVVLCQTTFETSLFERIAHAICERFQAVEVKNTICGATRARQAAVIDLIADGCDCIIVVGSKFSNNTKSLCGIAARNNCHSLMVENANDEMLPAATKFTKVGVIAGASTDEIDTEMVYQRLLSLIPE
jgi:4-hydroxy-3-methylbut-2-enyl diphosphate reductase